MRDLSGVLLFDKPPGATSNGVLQQVRKQYKAKKAGHTGSLDPLATGMLPICFGEATKLCGYMLNAEKTYSVIGKLGETTDSDDADGEVLTRAEIPEITLEHMQSVVAKFQGEQMQMPPVFSAIKKQGVRAYKLARQGKEVNLEPRAVNVLKIELKELGSDTFVLELRVSKGTYVRSIVRDIGEQLGCGAHVQELRRLSVSPFENQTMYTIDDINEAANADDLLIATDEVISDWPQLIVDEQTAMRFKNGSRPEYDAPTTLPAEQLFRVYAESSGSGFMGLGRIAAGKLETVRLINDPRAGVQ